MELTLKRLLEQAEFTQSRKGYDQNQVDDFLDRAVAMAAKVETRLTQAIEQAKEAGPGPAPVAAGPTPSEVEAEIERRVAEQVANAATAPASPTEDESAEEVRRTIVLAQRTADAAIREAREDAAKLLAEAEGRAASLQADTDAALASAKATLTAEVDRERLEAHERLAAEIGELEGTREALRSDVTVLERHVGEQRTQLEAALAELQRLLDDPAGLRVAPTPALLDPELPDFTPPAPEPKSEPESEAALDAEGAQPEGPDVSLSFGDVDHGAPGRVEIRDGGPPTAPVSAIDLGFAPVAPAPDPVSADEEDAFLAELRKAMADDEPLGPRDHTDAGPIGPGGHVEPFDEDDDRRSWRFGKRR